MKWLLLIFVLTNQNGEIHFSIDKMIEIETETLCKAARKTIIDDLNSQASKTTFTGTCIQIRNKPTMKERYKKYKEWWLELNEESNGKKENTQY